MENYEDAREYINRHVDIFYMRNPIGDNDSRIDDFHSHLLYLMLKLSNEGSDSYSKGLHILACKPQFHSCYTHCIVNGLKFVVWVKDQDLKIQNSGVLILAEEVNYYGLLQKIIKLKYAEGVLPVIICRCKWFNTDPLEGNIKIDHGIISIDTSFTWYDDAPYCLSKHAQQVFYVEDPKFGDNWKVVNVVAQRGTYSNSCIARDDESSQVADEAYQEDNRTNIPTYRSNDIDGYEYDEGLEMPRTNSALYYDFDIQTDDAAMDLEDEEGDFEEDEENEQDEYQSDYEGSDEVDDEEYGDDLSD
ncbi:hypothetical protein QQ045_032172 [Rhodiola kirilowii]